MQKTLWVKYLSGIGIIFLLSFILITAADSRIAPGQENQPDSTQVKRVEPLKLMKYKPDIGIDRVSTPTVVTTSQNKKTLKITITVRNLHWSKTWTGKFWVRLKYNRGNIPGFGFRRLEVGCDQKVSGLGTLKRRPPFSSTRRIQQTLTFYHKIDNIPNLLYRYKVIADFKDQVSESNERNNIVEFRYNN